MHPAACLKLTDQCVLRFVPADVLSLSCLCRFIILACDGLFKVFSADEAVKFVLGVLQVSVFSFRGLSRQRPEQ